jgi:nucleotide-binding universal stress UspA family protein
MKILATFDGSRFSEATLRQLEMMAHLPTAEFVFLAVTHEPHGRLQRFGGGRPDASAELVGQTPVVVDAPEPQWAENKGQAIERRRAQLSDYLHDIAAKLPPGPTIAIETEVSDEPADAIVGYAKEHQVDVIVMATHSRAGLAHALFGSTTEKVVRSGVAPVLVVHPAVEAKS